MQVLLIILRLMESSMASELDHMHILEEASII